MLHTKLARVLIERKILQKGSIIEAYYSTKGISGVCDASVLGTFKLNGAKATQEWVFFDTIGPEDKPFRIRCDYIISLDGMPIARIAESHQLTEAGEPVIPASRRGRKKKDEDAETDAED